MQNAHQHQFIAYNDIISLMRKHEGLVLAVSVFSLFLIPTAVNNAYASAEIAKSPKIIVPNHSFHDANEPVRVHFDVRALDYLGKSIPIQCDRYSGTVFDLGKTTVRCHAVDSFGNEARNSFVVTVGYDIVYIPSWLKNTTQFWLSGQMSDTEYTGMLEYLLENKILHVPYTTKSKDIIPSEIPSWIKTNSQNWVDGKASDDEFSIGIQWMIQRNLISL